MQGPSYIVRTYNSQSDRRIFNRDLEDPLSTSPEYLATYSSTQEIVPVAFASGSSERDLTHEYHQQRYYTGPDRGPIFGGPSSLSSSSQIHGRSPVYPAIYGNATGRAHAEPHAEPRSRYEAPPVPEEIAEYGEHRLWQHEWPPSGQPPINGHPSAPQMMSHSQIVPYEADKSTSMTQGDTGYFSTSSPQFSGIQVPTPASMAVLLNQQNARREESSPVYGATPPSPVPAPHREEHLPDSSNEVAQPPDQDYANQSMDDISSREKKHGCTMCHKRSAGGSWINIVFG